MRRLAATVAAGAVLALPGSTATAATAAPGSSASSAATSAVSSALASTAPASAPVSAPASAPASSGSSAGASTTVPPAPAASGNPLCSAEVVDSAGVLSGDDVEQLRSAGQDLTQTTVLRVRTASQLTGDLDAYEQQLERSCGWATSSGQRQPTLLVLLLDTDNGQTGIYAGPALTGVLTDKVAQAVQQQTMAQPFSRGDWTTGLQSGIEALDQLVGPGAAPSASFAPSALVSAGSAATPNASGQPATVSSLATAPLDSSGSGFPYAAVGLGAVAVVAVLGLGTFAFRRSSLSRPFAGDPEEAWAGVPEPEAADLGGGEPNDDPAGQGNSSPHSPADSADDP
jgi:uncharacterized membrane protein YgcG